MVKKFNYRNETIFFGYSHYTIGDGIAILAFTEEGELWCDISVNVPDLPPLKENEIYIPLYKAKDIYEKVFKDFFVEEEIAHVKIGYGDGVRVKLIDDFRDYMLDDSVI